jgi:hypothetical protein
MLAISSVWPSGLAWIAASVPTLVLAPGRLTATKDLAEPQPEPLAHQPRDEVGAAARRERHDDLDRPRRIFLRSPGHGGEQACHGCGGEMKTAERHRWSLFR